MTKKEIQQKFFAYGGMKRGQNTKLHIIDNDANVLCGVNSFWMEAFHEINEDGYLEGEEHLESIVECDATCKRCFRKWLKLTNPHPLKTN